MKAKDLIEKLQRINPETEIYVCSCSFDCMGVSSKDVELNKTNRTTWNSKTKSVDHNVITELQGVEN